MCVCVCVCETICDILFSGGGGGYQSDNLFWRKTHTKGSLARFPTRWGEDERRQGPRVNRSEQKKAESRRGQAREEDPVDSKAGLANARG